MILRRTLIAVAAFALMALMPQPSLAAAKANRCEAIFKPAPAPAVVSQLADLRVRVEAARTAGQESVARTLYARFRELVRDAGAVGVDLTELPRLIEERLAIKHSADHKRSEDEKKIVEKESVFEAWSMKRWKVDVKTGPGSMPAYTPDGKSLALPMADKIVIRDLESNRVTGRLQVDREVRDLLYSPDGTKILAIDVNGGGAVYEAATGKTLFELNPQGVYSIARWSADGSHVSLDTYRNSPGVDIYDVASGTLVREVDNSHIRAPLSNILSPDGSQYLKWSRPNPKPRRKAPAEPPAVRETATDRELFKLEGLEPTYSADGSRIITSKEKTVFIWDSAAGTKIAEFDVEGDVSSMTANRDASIIFVRNEDKVEAWSTATGLRLFTLQEPEGANFQKIELSGDGKKIVSISWMVEHNDARVDLAVWSAEDGHAVARFDHVKELTSSAEYLLVSEDGMHVAAPGWQASEMQTFAFRRHSAQSPR